VSSLGHLNKFRLDLTDSLRRIHIVNIVTFPDGSKFHDDVGFGGDGATMAMPLIDGLIHQNMGAQEVRLVRDWVSTQVRRTEESKLWIYQYRNSVDGDWNSFYAFPELEFMAADWEVVNWWTGSSPRSWQTYTVLVIKFLRRQKEVREIDGAEQEIFGKRMLVNRIVKENLGGKTKFIQDWKTERERVEGLESLFGINLTDDEISGIKGWVTELKDVTIISA
jgi:arylamine N-acetyltransferase